MPGPENIIADAFSRLLTVEDPHMLCLMDEFVIPTDKFKIIADIHNSHNGHFGVERTMSKLTAKINGKNIYPAWPYMREHVRRFIKTCDCCQKMSQIRIPIETLNFTAAAYEPMQTLNVDSIGPLPEDDDGYTYIIVIICCFTRWVSLYCAKDATAASAAKALQQHVSIFGQSAQLLSDNGPQYVNATISELLLLLGTEHVRTVAHSHEENTIVERANKEVMRHLRALLFDDKSHRKWSLKLPVVQRIMNASVHESIGVAPAQLVLNSNISLDRNVYLPVSALNVTDRQLSSWADKSINLQRKILEKAQQMQRAKDEKSLRTRAERAVKRKWTEDDLKIGNYVLAAYPETGMGHRAPNKFMSPLRGPYEIVGKRNRSCALRDLNNDKVTHVKVQLLKPYNHDPSRQKPEDAAMHDKEYFHVEQILKHKGTWNKLKSLQFLVRWTGYDQDHDSWEPWAELRENEHLHSYMKKQGQHKLIPQKFRNTL